MPSLTRRQVLAAVGSTGVALTGCLSQSPPSGDLGTVEGAWPMAGRDAAHTRNSSSGPTDPETVWTAAPDEARSVGTPAVGDGRLFAPVDAVSEGARHRYRLHALEAATGEETWQVPLRSEPNGPPAVRGSQVALTARRSLDRGRVVVFGTESGDEDWLVDVDARLTAPPTVDDDGVVYVPDWSGRVHAFRLSIGAEQWTRTVDGDGHGRTFTGPAAVADDTVYLGSRSGKTGVVALDAATGERRWSVSTPAVTGGPVVHPEGIVVQCHQLVVALDADGTRRWSFNVADEDARPLAVDDQHVYVSGRNAVYAIDWRGENGWVFDPSDGRVGTPTVAGDAVLVRGDGRLTALDAATGEKQWAADASGTGRAVVTPEAVFCSGDGGSVVALGEQ